MSVAEFVFEKGVWWYFDGYHRRKYMAAESYGKCCKMCGVGLNEDNWAQGNLKKNVYICRSCDSIKGKRNRLKRLASSIGKQAVNQYSKVKEGYVYILTNPAWPDWVKVGMAIDAEDRCNSYQTSSPFRDYELHYQVYTKDRRRLERQAHGLVGEVAESQYNEWFKIPVPIAVTCISDLLKQQNSPQ